mgnify:CR=1 FL=1
MDERAPSGLSRAPRSEPAQVEQDAVLRVVGAPARPGFGSKAERGGQGSPSPAVEWFEERAAVIEFESGERRIHAESMALREVVEHMGKAAGREAYDHMNARRKIV